MEEKQKKARSDKKNIYTVLMLICVIVFLFALYKVVGILLDYKEIDDYYNEAKEEYVVEDDGGISYIKLAELIKKNVDVKGWIYIKDTDISYPLLQGSDNQYYLYRNYDKQYLGAGSIFIEASNSSDLSDLHTIIYGHNMHNGAMFGTLDKFFKESYRDEHPYVYVMLPDGKWNKYEIFAAYTADIEDGTFTVFSEGDTAYNKYLELIESKNTYKNTVPPENGEQILTLSTCTEDSNDYKRNVLQAKFMGKTDKID